MLHPLWVGRKLACLKSFFMLCVVCAFCYNHFQEETMRYAVIDTGSNTIRMGIYEEENGILKQIYNHAVFANLAGYMENGALSQAGIRAAEDVILSHIETAATYGCIPRVFATAAIRNAENTEEICQKINNTCHTTLDVLPGEEEALFSFYGAASDFPCSDGVMADVGGGSSEIISFSQKAPVAALSIPWGSLKIYNAFVRGVLPTQEEINSIQDTITDALKQNETLQKTKSKNLCIVGGGVRASLKLCKEFLGHSTLTTKALSEILSIIINAPDSASKTIGNLVPDRAKTIAPAIAIYAAIGTFFEASEMFVSDQGIKEGYILKKMMPQNTMD